MDDSNKVVKYIKKRRKEKNRWLPGGFFWWITVWKEFSMTFKNVYNIKKHVEIDTYAGLERFANDWLPFRR